MGCILLVSPLACGNGGGRLDEPARGGSAGAAAGGLSMGGSSAGSGPVAGGLGGETSSVAGAQNGGSGNSGRGGSSSAGASGAGAGAGTAMAGARSGGSGGAGVPSDYTPPSGLRSDTVLKDGWKFLKSDASGASAVGFNDAGWTSLSLPHTFNSSDGQDGGNDYYRGPSWYRMHYALPTAAAGKSVYLQFDGASTVASVYVNGTLLGEHRGGFGRFRFDATSALRADVDNVIAVKVSNALATDVAPLTGDFTIFGGLYRGVHVLVTDLLHIDTEDYASSGVYLDTTQVSALSANLKARVRVRNNRSAAQAVEVVTTLVDRAGKLAATLEATGTVQPNATVELSAMATLSNPHLWNGRVDPHLYTAHTELQLGSVAVDYVAQSVGFRFFGVDANQGFTLNGQYLNLHGVNRHQDRLNKGWAITDAEQDEDFGLIEELGATALRLAHYQHAEHVYDLADQIGLVTWAEVPGQHRH